MKEIKELLKQEISKKLSISPEDVRFDIPPSLKMGDISLLSAFIIGKRDRFNPRTLALSFVEKLKELPMVEQISTHGPFINLKLKREEFFQHAYMTKEKIKVIPRDGKNLVEHTNINPNKAAHVGHLRNAILGDSFSRLLRIIGEKIEVHNYIDDTGVQVADVVYGLLRMKNLPPEKWNVIQEKFDHYCWDLYVEVEKEMEENPEARKERLKILKSLEEGEGEYAKAGKALAEKISSLHLQTMEKLGIEYDLLTWESHIISLGFWELTFKKLKESSAIRFTEEGPNAGCWVLDVEEGGQTREKVIVRSNGTATYVAKDIAYQMWKLGLLPRDFKYSVFKEYPSGRKLYTTTINEGFENDFGKADRVYNVIDIRQSYLQKIVVEAIKRMGYEEKSRNSIHLGYEMVALSRKTAREMGFEVEGEAVSISGRKGIGIKADDLIDAVYRTAREEVKKRNPEMPAEKINEIAEKITVGAIRYYMLKFTNSSLVLFDIEDALSFEGESGPYIQYSLVRMKGIRRKMQERGLKIEGEPYWKDNDDYWELLHKASQFDDVLEKTREKMELSFLAKYLFSLAQSFNIFYQKYPIIKEFDENERRLRLALMEIVEAKLKIGAEILGIEVPDRM